MSPGGVFLIVVIVGTMLAAGAGFGLRRYGRALVADEASGIAEKWLDAVTVLFVLLALGALFLLAGQLPEAEGSAQAVGLKIGFVLLGLGGLYLGAMVLLTRVAGRRVFGTSWRPGR